MVLMNMQRVAGMCHTALVFVYMGTMAGFDGGAGIVNVGMMMARINRCVAANRVNMRITRPYNGAGYTSHIVPVPVINACFVAIPVHVLVVMLAVVLVISVVVVLTIVMMLAIVGSLVVGIHG
jgi:hypothetical protein